MGCHMGAKNVQGLLGLTKFQQQRIVHRGPPISDRAPRISGLGHGLVDFVGWNFVGDGLAENLWRLFPSDGTLGYDF